MSECAMTTPTKPTLVPAGLARVLKMVEDCPPPKLVVVEVSRLRVVSRSHHRRVAPRPSRTGAGGRPGASALGVAPALVACGCRRGYLAVGGC